MFSGPVRLTPCPSFETLITNVLPTSLCLLSIILVYRRPYIRKISKSISNTSARTDAHRHLGHLAAIAPSLHVRPLRPTPFTCRVPPPTQTLLLRNHVTSDCRNEWNQILDFRLSSCLACSVYSRGGNKEKTCHGAEILRRQRRQKARNLQHMGGMSQPGDRPQRRFM